jgi:hypothetical protein
MPTRTQRSQLLTTYWTLLMEQGFPAETAASMFDAYVKTIDGMGFTGPQKVMKMTKPKRKLSAWNKFVKANSSKKIYKFANGKLKLKKMGIAFRKTSAGKKKK